MNLNDIAIKRLYSQNLENQRCNLTYEMVSWLGAVQAQDYSGAKWSLGIRLPGTTDKDIEQALKDKTVVRTWAMRGTLHFVAAADIHWLLELLAPRIIKNNTRRYNELKLDEKTISMANTVLKGALDHNYHRTRSELLAILEQNGISTEGQRAAYMLQRASLEGLICQGITTRNNPTYISIDELPKPRNMKREDALAELANRYFKGHGPATLKDFVWWSGLLVKDARLGLDNIKSKLKKEVIGGRTYWMAPIKTIDHRSPKVNLLPGFDEYLLSYKDRSASIDFERVKKFLAPANGFFRSTIIIEGKVEGIWKRTLNKNRVLISLNHFRTFSVAEKDALAIEIIRYGKFLEMPVEIQ